MSNKVLSKLYLNPGSLSVPSINYKNLATGDNYPTFYQNTNNILSWTTATPSGTGWRGVCWSKELSLFVAVSDTTGTTNIATSPTGAIWTTQTGPNTQSLFDVIWIPQLSLFVACAVTGTLNRIITSSNGTSWTARTTPVDNSWSRLAWSPELGIIVCVSSNGTNNRVMTSYDAINWTIRTTPTDSDWRGICWASELGVFVAVGTNTGTNRVMTSSDGISWSLQTAASVSDWLSVCWSPELNLLVAVAAAGAAQVYTSPDAVNWTTRTATAIGWHKVCWAAELGLFVACAYTGTNRIMTSINGTTWVDYSITANQWLGICWSKELSTFVAVAGSGTNLAAYSINKNNLVHSNSATSNVYSSGFLTLDNSYDITTNRLISKKMVSQSLRLHDATVGTGASNLGALVITGGIGLGNNSTTPSRITFGTYTLADPGSNKLIALFNNNANTNNHQFYGFGINSNTLRYQVDITSASHVFYAATGSDTSQELFRIKGNQTAQLQNGTVAIPSLSFQNDNNIGLYRIAEDSMGITTGGKLNTQTTFAQPALPFTDANLLLYYSFRNSLLTDTSANNYTLTNNTAVTRTDRTDSTNGITLYNTATSANPHYLYRTITGDTNLTNALASTVGISMSIWVYKASTTASNCLGFQNVAFNGVVNTNTNKFYVLYYANPSIVIQANSSGSAVYFQANYTISINQWYHIAFNHNSSGFTLYVNGILTTPTSFTTGSSTTAYNALTPLTSTGSLTVGNVGGATSWDGSLKNVMLSSTAWTATQVQQIYNNQLRDVFNATDSTYVFNSDLNTGLIRQKNNTLALASDGNTKLYMDTAGCVINFKYAVVSTATYELTLNDYQIELSYEGATTVTLPLSTLDVHSGRQYILIKTSTTGAGAVTINIITPDTINGSLTSLTLTNQYDRTHFTSNGTGIWYTI